MANRKARGNFRDVPQNFNPSLMALKAALSQGFVMGKVPANRIEELRKAKGLTLEELAERSGFSTPFVWQMAHGVRNISLKNLGRLATALGCQPEDLLGTDKMSNSDLLNLWAAIPVDRRELAMQVLQSFVNTSALDAETPITDSHRTAGKRGRRQK